MVENTDHFERLRQGADLWNQWRNENPDIVPALSQVNLIGTSLVNVNLIGANLIGADLTNAELWGANLSSAKLSRANLICVNLSGSILIDANLIGADVNRADLSGSILIGGILIGANFSSADLSGADLIDTNLSSANLEGANLSSANLIGADLSGANLSGANLTNANLSGVNLIGGSLSGANLSGANLRNADLSGVNLIDANLRNADLSGVKLIQVQAFGSNFRRALLTGACIQGWNINSSTNLQDVVCDYVFTEPVWGMKQYTNRNPHDPDQIFAPGEFTKLYQIALGSVDLYFDDGIDWKAFLAALKELQLQYGDELLIREIGNRGGGSCLVRLDLPSHLEPTVIEQKAKDLYTGKLQIVEAEYRELNITGQEIELYKRKSADILELVKLAASRPIVGDMKTALNSDLLKIDPSYVPELAELDYFTTATS